MREDIGANAHLLVTHLLTGYSAIPPGNPRLIGAGGLRQPRSTEEPSETFGPFVGDQSRRTTFSRWVFSA